MPPCYPPCLILTSFFPDSTHQRAFCSFSFDVYPLFTFLQPLCPHACLPVFLFYPFGPQFYSLLLTFPPLLPPSSRLYPPLRAFCPLLPLSARFHSTFIRSLPSSSRFVPMSASLLPISTHFLPNFMRSSSHLITFLPPRFLLSRAFCPLPPSTSARFHSTSIRNSRSSSRFVPTSATYSTNFLPKFTHLDFILTRFLSSGRFMLTSALTRFCQLVPTLCQIRLFVARSFQLPVHLYQHSNIC
jgi:hypothetical protein